MRWGLLPCAHNRLFGYLSVGQLIASVFAELAARVPRKNVGFEEIVINFAKRKSKKANNNTTKQQQLAPPPLPLPQREGSE